MNASSCVDYDQISATYDDVRTGDLELINYFLQAVPINNRSALLEIGCGTGNYADLLQRLTLADVTGLDPSAGMLQMAGRKNSRLTLKQGRAESLPLADARFDFVYMVDVIHHVGKLDRLLAEIGRVLKPKAKACIVTQSHAQIKARPITRFFPETAAVDTQRYPSIAEIIAHAQGEGLRFENQETIFADESIELGDEFLALVRAKGYSMLHLISESAYVAGVDALEHTLELGPMVAKRAGETAVWVANE